MWSLGVMAFELLSGKPAVLPHVLQTDKELVRLPALSIFLHIALLLVCVLFVARSLDTLQLWNTRLGDADKDCEHNACCAALKLVRVGAGAGSCLLYTSPSPRD